MNIFVFKRLEDNCTFARRSDTRIEKGGNKTAIEYDGNSKLYK